MDYPAPLVPAEVDLTDFKFMPLEVARLLRSEWWLTAGAEDTRRAYAAINLWANAWHQIPAASVPSNEIVLAKLADTSLSVWREIRDAVMEPWVLCSDGRFYHPVVAEKAIEAWTEKQEYQRRKAAFSQQQKARIAKRWSREKEAEDTAEDTTEDTEEDTGRITGRNTNERDRDMDRDRDKSQRDKSLLSDAAAPDVPDGAAKEPYSAEFEAFWQAFPKREGKRTAFLAWQRAKKRANVAAIMDGAKAYAVARANQDSRYTKQPATWLNGDGWADEQPKEKKGVPPIRGYVPMGVGG